MKKRNLPLSLLLIIIALAGTGFVLFSSGNQSGSPSEALDRRSDVPVMKPAAEYLAGIRNNQITGLLDPADVLQARNQDRENSETRSATALDWLQIGPDNFGGRTRAIIFDNTDASSKTIYAAAVTGGIWKSINGGITWNKVNKNGANLYVSCMLQASNGDIYVGTGEGFSADAFTGLGQMGYTGGMMGQGVFKSTDGDKFTLIESTKPTLNDDQGEWAFVNELALVDGNNRLYAATNTGLKFSNNDGESWAFAKDTAGNELAGNAYDVKVGSNGAVIVSLNNLCYVSSGPTNAFVLRSTGDSISLPNTGIGRVELAIAPSNPNVMYASIADFNGNTFGVYKSDDKGATWRVIMPTTPSLEIFEGEGAYANTIVVFPNDPHKVLLGGIDLWQGTQYDENGLFFWERISESLSGPLSPYYLHADHHTYVFEPGSDVHFFVGTDGGVSEGTLALGEYTYKTNNRNYFTTQFYSVGLSGFKRKVIGGAQDNGTVVITGRGNTREQGSMIFGGDGGPCAFSLIDGDVLVLSSTSGRLRRSEDGGENYSTDAQFLDGGKVGNAQAFKTPIALWESFNNENSRDSLWFYPIETIPGGTTIKIRSENRGQPFWYTTPSDVTLNPGDSIRIQDRVSAVLFVPVANTIWMTWDMHKFNKVPEWFTIYNRDFGFEGIPQCIAYSADGNHIFVGTREGRLFRISNLALAYDYDRADVNSPSCIVSTQEIPIMVPGTDDPISQVITSVAVDPENSNNVMITLGNYGNEHYVFFSSNALDQTPDFETRQGNLPQMPVYASIIEMNDGNLGIIGTEFGIYSTKNLQNASPVWKKDGENIGNVPVFDLKQQIVSKEYMQVKLVNGPEVIIYDYYGTNNYGSIYAATYGKGLFRSDKYFLVGTDENTIGENSNGNTELKIYPNPVSSIATVELDLNTNREVVFYVFDLNGRMVQSQTTQLSKGNNTLRIDVSSLQPGVYFIQAIAGSDTRTQKFIVK